VSGALIRAEDLEVGYAQPVVGPLSFTVLPGEVVGLAGPNGSGKSTVLKALANHVRVFAGNMHRRSELTIGWLQQQPLQLPEMPFNGWEYLRYARAADAPPAHLAAWLDQRVDSLSGGQFQLLNVWAVLSSVAELLLLDEPTNNLDVEGEQILANTLKQLEQRRGVLLVSHDRAFLERVCDRVLEVGG